MSLGTLFGTSIHNLDVTMELPVGPHRCRISNVSRSLRKPSLIDDRIEDGKLRASYDTAGKMSETAAA